MSDIIIRDNALLSHFILRRSGCAGHFIFLNDSISVLEWYLRQQDRRLSIDADKIGKCSKHFARE